MMPRLGRGFTLIELLLVLVIMGMAAAVVAPNIGTGRQTAVLRAATRELASALRYVRAQALIRQRDSELLLDLQHNSYQVTGRERPYTLDAEIAITLDTAASEIQDAARGSIRFFPDGSSTGGKITLELAERKSQITVNWLTGLVETHEL